MTTRFLARPPRYTLLRSIVIAFAICILSHPTTQSISAGSETIPSPIVSGKALQVPTSGGNLASFHLLTADEGWILLDQQLYWTRNGGKSWLLIPPAPLSKGDTQRIATAFFLDTQRGWVVAAEFLSNLSIGRTLDTGASWQTRSLSLLSPGDPDAFVAAVHLYFVDAQTGWLVTRRATSSNFDVGALFKTTDGGDTWTRLSIPIGDPVYFATPDLGWVAGGATHDQIFATRDGGRTWSDIMQETLRVSKSLRVSTLLPKFENARDGVLPVIVAAGSESRLDLYRTRDGGLTWEPVSQLPLGREIAPGTRFPISILNAEQSIAILPDRRVATRSPSGITAITASRDLLAGGIRELDMATPSIGWAKHVDGSCVNGDKSQCAQTTRLLRTADGGQSWETLAIPATPISPSSPTPLTPLSKEGTVRAASPSAFTATVTGQGFDACRLPIASQFQNWWANSPYIAYNLYIGGSALAACDPLSASFVSQLASQGWKFFPTWVGPQASCGGIFPRMSSDPTTAYNQGVAEANSALNAAYSLGLTDASKTGTIIYYDLEGYNTNDSTCRTAADYLIRGWSAQLKATGNAAGAYGASCGSAVSDWAGAPDPQQIPDILWLAWGQFPYMYRYNATVWGAPCLSDSLWVNHQRLRQYAGGHNETWGGVTLNIDSDVLDGIVASLSNVAKIYRNLFPFVAK